MQPKTISTKIGKHQLELRYQPNADPDQQWEWVLKVTKEYVYRGMCSTTGECRLAAIRYTNMHDQLESNR